MKKKKRGPLSRRDRDASIQRAIDKAIAEELRAMSKKNPKGKRKMRKHRSKLKTPKLTPKQATELYKQAAPMLMGMVLANAIRQHCAGDTEIVSIELKTREKKGKGKGEK